MKNTENLSIFKYDKITTARPELVVDILQATDHAYTAAANSPGGQAANLTYSHVKQSPSCFFVADHISTYLTQLDKGYQASTLSANFLPENIAHVVTTIKMPEATETIIADATWQQFLARRSLARRAKERLLRPKMPNVLIGTKTEVAKAALHFGFDKHQASTWNRINNSNITSVIIKK